MEVRPDEQVHHKNAIAPGHRDRWITDHFAEVCGAATRVGGRNTYAHGSWSGFTSPVAYGAWPIRRVRGPEEVRCTFTGSALAR
jgi:hypothetical protein